jgi:hypothetical protein
VQAKGLFGLGLVLAGTGPVRAECMGSCADDLMAALISILVYGVIGIVLLVMLIRTKWRRAGRRWLGIIVVLALGVPFVSQGWIAWKLRATEAREVIGAPPPLASRTPLLISPNEYCSDSACEMVLRGRGAEGAFVVLTRALDGMDLTGPIPLVDLPLEHWSGPGATGQADRKVLSPAERQDAASRIDYLVITAWPYNPAEPGPVEAALRMNPRLAGMESGEAVRLLLAPLGAGEGVLSLATVQPDLLDLSLVDRALAIPLAPRNTQGAKNSPAGVIEAARAICPAQTGEALANCQSVLDR